MTLADILIPLAGSISNEKALKMREACDLLESRVDINQRGTNHAHDLISLLTDRVKELERDNLDRRLTKLERAVDVLDRQRVETLNLRVNGLEHTKDRHKRILEFIEYECVSPLEDRVSKLESATKNTGEGSTSQTGAVSHSQSGGGSDGTREPARSARIDDAGTTQDTPSPDFTVKPCPCGAPARIRQADDDWMISCTDIACDWCIVGGLYASKEDMLRAWNRRAPAETLRAVRGGGCTCTHEKRLHANATDGCLVSGCRCETYTGEGRAEEALSGNGRDQERAQPVRAAPPGAQALDVAGEGREPSRQAAPSPAPSVPANATGEVPAWIPSVEEMLELIDDGREGDLISLIASRATAAPVVDVNALLTRFYSELDVCDLESKAMARALAAQGIKCKEVQP